MSLENTVNDEIKIAMKARDEAGLRTLRAIKAAILVEKTAEGAKEMDQAAEQKLLIKMAKQRRDSLDIYSTQNRADLAAKEEEELAVIERFLPKQLTAEELESEVKAIMESVGAKSPADMGKVMGSASKQLAGRADGKAISEMVKTLLSKA